MIAKGHNCNYSIDSHDFNWQQSEENLIHLDLGSSSNLGVFYHKLIELWLSAVKEESIFPINSGDEFSPRFRDFFASSRDVLAKLNQRGYHIENGYTNAFKEFSRNSKIQDYLYAILGNHSIIDLIVEEKIPQEASDVPQVGGSGVLKISGIPDCVLICDDLIFVIDWKTKIIDDRDAYYSIQLYLYKLLVDSLIPSSKIEGRIVSILENDGDYPLIKFCDSLLQEFQVDSSYLEGLVERDDKTVGPWCQNCKYNLIKGHDICEERSGESELIGNKRYLLNPNFHPNYLFDVEFNRTDLNFKSNSIFMYAGEYHSIAVDFHGKLHGISEEYNLIRCKGRINVEKNGNRVFHVIDFVTI